MQLQLGLMIRSTKSSGQTFSGRFFAHLGDDEFRDRPFVDEERNRNAGYEAQNLKDELRFFGAPLTRHAGDRESESCDAANNCSGKEATNGANEKEDKPSFEVFRFVHFDYYLGSGLETTWEIEVAWV